MEKSKLGMHEGHCCVLHGCKYGDEDCPVISGETQQRSSVRAATMMELSRLTS